MMKADLKFPELTLKIESSCLKQLVNCVENLRSGECSSIIAEQNHGSADVVELVAGADSETDLYTRRGGRLTLILSPEAIELLLFKLREFESFGSTSTPEFQDFYPASKSTNRRHKTLRVFLAVIAV